MRTTPDAPMRDIGPVTARLDTKWTSAVVGMPVQSSAGETLGRVQEVIVDGYGRPGFAVVAHGGVMGFGAQHIAIPWAMVAEMLDRDRLVVDRSILERAPVLASEGADGRRGEWRRDAERYWSAQVALAR